MKPAPFDYIRATSLDHALTALGEHDDAIVVAGGQTLVPMMAMRLARPSLLVDLNEIADLSGIVATEKHLSIRAMTRQAKVLASDIVRAKAPLLAKALSFVGHTQTRNRGTVGGSIAHGDPSAEIPLCAVALNAEIDLMSKNGTRMIEARDFYTGTLMSVRRPDEILSGVRFPIWSGEGIGVGFQEISPRHGDFAIVAVAVQLQFDADKICRRAAVALGGASPNPVRAAELEASLFGQRITAELLAKIIGSIDRVLAPTDDLHASAAYRRRVARVLTERAILEAAA
jgi:CO/xanthine dehydrogenase FAD-binding subunit